MTNEAKGKKCTKLFKLVCRSWFFFKQEWHKNILRLTWRIVEDKDYAEKVSRQELLMRRNPRSGETKYMLDYPYSVCYFIRPWRPVRQISDLQNKRSWTAGERKLLLIIGEQFLALRKVQTLTVNLFNDYLKNVTIFVIVIFYICVCVYIHSIFGDVGKAGMETMRTKLELVTHTHTQSVLRHTGP